MAARNIADAKADFKRNFSSMMPKRKEIPARTRKCIFCEQLPEPRDPKGHHKELILVFTVCPMPNSGIAGIMSP